MLERNALDEFENADENSVLANFSSMSAEEQEQFFQRWTDADEDLRLMLLWQKNGFTSGIQVLR